MSAPSAMSAFDALGRAALVCSARPQPAGSRQSASREPRPRSLLLAQRIVIDDRHVPERAAVRGDLRRVVGAVHQVVEIGATRRRYRAQLDRLWNCGPYPPDDHGESLGWRRIWAELSRLRCKVSPGWSPSICKKSIVAGRLWKIGSEIWACDFFCRRLRFERCTCFS